MEFREYTIEIWYCAHNTLQMHKSCKICILINDLHCFSLFKSLDISARFQFENDRRIIYKLAKNLKPDVRHNDLSQKIPNFH